MLVETRSFREKKKRELNENQFLTEIARSSEDLSTDFAGFGGCLNTQSLSHKLGQQMQKELQFEGTDNVFQ